MSILSVENLSLKFGKNKVLKDISFDLQPNELIVILGSSGAGKTSLLKSIVGLYKPKGKILIKDKNVTKLTPEQRKIAYMPQHYALFPKMTLIENVSFSPMIQGKTQHEIDVICDSILNLVHLADRKYAFPNELSGGMKQRTALARSLATQYPILLLDEPLRALDARLRIELRSELRKLVKNLGFSVLMVTHDQNEAMSIADKILVLNKGKIEQIGTQESIYYAPENIFVASFLDEINQLNGIIKNKQEFNLAKLPESWNNIDKNKPYYKYSIECLSGDLLHAYSQKNYSIDENIYAVIKCESIRVKYYHDEKENSTEGHHTNTIHGFITNKYFLGNWTKLHVESDNCKWIIKLPSIRADKYEINEKLILRFKPYNVFLFSKTEEDKDHA